MTTARTLSLEPDLQLRLARRTEALERVRRMLIHALKLDLEPEHIDPDTPLFGAGLGLDSVDAIELVVALETTFGVTIDDNQMLVSALRTVNSVVDLILARPGGGEP